MAGNKWRVALWALAGTLLLLPYIAMQVTDQVRWSGRDFILGGALLFGTGFAFELALRKSASIAYRAGAGLALAGAVFLLWLCAAVGIVGSEQNGANAVFGLVVVAGVLSAVRARFEAGGMARAMLATAFVQVLVTAAALVAGWGSESAKWPWDMLALSGGFTAIWICAAALFWRANKSARAM